MAGSMISANTRNLIQATSIVGMVADKYFAVTSEHPRNTVDAKIKAMPRNGRSARAGAAEAAAFVATSLSGKGNEPLSSRTAVAEGGVKMNSARISNRVSGQKTIIGRQ